MKEQYRPYTNSITIGAEVEPLPFEPKGSDDGFYEVMLGKLRNIPYQIQSPSRSSLVETITVKPMVFMTKPRIGLDPITGNKLSEIYNDRILINARQGGKPIMNQLIIDSAKETENIANRDLFNIWTTSTMPPGIKESMERMQTRSTDLSDSVVPTQRQKLYGEDLPKITEHVKKMCEEAVGKVTLPTSSKGRGLGHTPNLFDIDPFPFLVPAVKSLPKPKPLSEFDASEFDLTATFREVPLMTPPALAALKLWPARKQSEFGIRSINGNILGIDLLKPGSI